MKFIVDIQTNPTVHKKERKEKMPSDTYMPDQIAVRFITARGSEEEGWDIYWLTPCACIDPIAKDGLYPLVLTDKLPWLGTIPFNILWDEYNHYGLVIDRRNGKPILELVGENVG